MLSYVVMPVWQARARREPRSAVPRPSSKPRVRSTVPTRAASRSPCSTARSSRIDGSHKNPVTDGYICAKVRKFGERVYGPDRLLYPGGPQGPQGRGPVQARDVGRSARARSPSGCEQREGRARRRSRSCRYSYGGSNGLLTQDNIDAQLCRRLGTSRLARTVCAAPTGAANMALYGKMPSVTYQDYPEAQLIVLWGVNPSASGIHLVPYVREAQKRGAKLVVDRSAHDAARAAGRRAPRGAAGHRRRRRARDPPLSVRRTGYADEAFLARAHARRRRAARARASRGRSSARPRSPASTPRRSSGSPSCTPTSSPALIRCGWGLERNRNGGNAAMAVLALPAVGGKFGVRGGGYSMSNSASWSIERHVDRRAGAATRASST